MAHDKEKILKQALAEAKKKERHFLQDVIAFLPCSTSTFYEFFPADSEELESIKEFLAKNKIQTKIEIREKLKKGDKAAELIALYKLIATPEERMSLSMQHVDHTTKGKPISKGPAIDYSKLSTETLKDLANNTKTEDDGE